VTETGRVEVWRSRGGLWRFRYLPAEDGHALRSNRSFASREEALESAGIAYPGAAVERLRGAPVLGVEDIDRTWRTILLVLGGLALGALYVVLKLVLALRRRYRKVARAVTMARSIATTIQGAARPRA
jgi:hypothetical protein